MAHLTGLGLSNFRVFANEEYFEFAPITVLTGTNSSGKSSVIKALLLLQAQELGKHGRSINFFRGGNFLDLFFDDTAYYKHHLGEFKFIKNKANENIKFALHFSSDINEIYLDHNLQIGFQFSKNKENGFLENLTILDGNTDVIKLENMVNNEHINYAATINIDYFLKKIDDRITFKYSFLKTITLNFLNINESLLETVRKAFIEEMKEQNKFTYDLRSLLRSYHQSEKRLTDYLQLYLQYILYKSSDAILFEYTSPTRLQVERFYTSDNTSPQVWEVLKRYADLDLNHDDKYVQDFLLKWLGKNGFDLVDDIDIVFSSGDKKEIQILVRKDGKRLNLADLGFGVSQLLPLIVRIPTCKPELIVLEEIESNLHPKLQSMLADMIWDAHKTFGKRFIIETHSEYFIRRLQYLTAKGDIKPEETAIYYFYHPNNIPAGEKQVKRIRIQEDGRLDGEFGEGFFDEASRLMMELFKFSKD